MPPHSLFLKRSNRDTGCFIVHQGEELQLLTLHIKDSSMAVKSLNVRCYKSEIKMNLQNNLQNLLFTYFVLLQISFIDSIPDLFIRKIKSFGIY